MAYLLLAVVVGYAVIALVNTQILATAERRREFALLRLVGATRRQVLHMMTMKVALVAAGARGLISARWLTGAHEPTAACGLTVPAG